MQTSQDETLAIGKFTAEHVSTTYLVDGTYYVEVFPGQPIFIEVSAYPPGKETERETLGTADSLEEAAILLREIMADMGEGADDDDD